MNSFSKMIMENSFSRTEIPKTLTCTICQKLLNDACKGPCRCLFCWKCIEEYLNNGEIFCPTNNDNCKIHKLSLYHNIIRDFKINQMVLKFNVICPFSGCNYQNELQKMSDHLRTCKERNYCPYYEIGCCVKLNSFEDISNHLQTDNYQHVNLMIEWMMNLKNEFQRADHLNMTSILNTIQDKLVQPVESRKQNENPSIPLSKEKKSESLINFQSDLDKLKAEFYKFRLQSETKIGNLNKTIENLQNEIESMKIKVNNGEPGISFEGTPIKIWKISNFQEKIMKNENLLSDTFEFGNNGHILSLSLFPDQPKGYISVYIRHLKNARNLPFSGLFSIRISNQSSPTKQKNCQKFCTIDTLNRSEPFKFQHQELKNSEILGDQIIIEFFISH